MDTDYHNPEEFLKKEGMIVPLDKPQGWTSFDAVNKLRVFLKYHHNIPRAKTGHAGTLDPLATGLLLICVGRATKQISLLQELPKTYTGAMLLGSSTPSFDAETEVNRVISADHITKEMMFAAAQSFTGEMMQVPPLYSAIRFEGIRAYKMARKNQELTLPARPVVIHAFRITSINGLEVSFEITCSKGTYIRAIARDFGETLGSCAYLTSLRRTRIGSYDVADAFTVETIAEAFATWESPSSLKQNGTDTVPE